ncbi:hypothetical protein QRE62_26225 [Bacillus mycoides]|uniref:hypothetical protein n=1 Tax=Bacillus cereus group TaxID=86661 RepID=UPI000BF4B7AA|nr:MULTISPECIES: hypothetical protein [Bacillus cereus group]PFN03670.1 hypothetical protein COJ65_00245 [Bacillus cereus]WJE75880.1 hypothetical protein QRE62_26225 [Bacillus mycoides]
MDERKGFVDTETGELISYEEMRARMSEETEAVSRSQKEGYQKRLDVERHLFTDKRKFLKYSRLISKELKGLSLTDASVLLRLSMHLYYGGSGLIKVDSSYDEKDKNAMTVAEMRKVTGKSRQGLINSLERLEKLDAITVDRTKGKRTTYRINEKYIACGEGDGIKKNHVKVYTATTKEKVKNMPKPKQDLHMDKLTDTEAGILFKLMPYVHEKNYILCENPTERDMTKVRHMNVQELAAAVGIKYSSFRNTLKSLRQKGIIAKVSCGVTYMKGDAHVLNPRLVDCGYHMNREFGGQIAGIFDALAVGEAVDK